MPWHAHLARAHGLEARATRARAHGYYDVNPDVVWGTTARDLPPLIVQGESLLKSGGRPR